VSTELPDLGDLDARIAAFKKAAMQIASEPRKGIASDHHD
jgi:hypothetical protein